MENTAKNSPVRPMQLPEIDPPFERPCQALVVETSILLPLRSNAGTVALMAWTVAKRYIVDEAGICGTRQACRMAVWLEDIARSVVEL